MSKEEKQKLVEESIMFIHFVGKNTTPLLGNALIMALCDFVEDEKMVLDNVKSHISKMKEYVGASSQTTVIAKEMDDWLKSMSK